MQPAPHTDRFIGHPHLVSHSGHSQHLVERLQFNPVMGGHETRSYGAKESISLKRHMISCLNIRQFVPGPHGAVIGMAGVLWLSTMFPHQLWTTLF
jgi:hypothetical protein